MSFLKENPFVINYPVGFLTAYLVFPIQLFVLLHMPQHQYQWASLAPATSLFQLLHKNGSFFFFFFFAHCLSSSAWQRLTTQQPKPVRGGFAVAAVHMAKGWHKKHYNNTDMSHKAQSEMRPEYTGCCCDLEQIMNAVRVGALFDLMVCEGIPHLFFKCIMFLCHSNSPSPHTAQQDDPCVW